MRPRSSVLMLAVAAAVAMPAHAQWSAGLKGGIGQSSFTGANEFTWQSSALRAALFLTRRFGDKIAIQPELFFAEKIGAFDSMPGSTFTFAASYLELPVLLRYTPGRVLTIEPYALVGPVLSYRVGCNRHSDTAGVVSDSPCDVTPGKGTLDVGAGVGIGFSRAVKTVTLHLEARGSINARATDVSLGTGAANHYAWGVLAGASVPFSFRRPAFGDVPATRTATAGAQDAPESLPAMDIAGPVVPAAPSTGAEGVAAPVNAKRITLTASNADARTLLLAIAREAGISLVVSEDVRRRISVSFTDALAEDALAAIVTQAGLSIARTSSVEIPPVVYYQLPVNMNQASVEAIAARFGVSLEMARWIVEARQSGRP